MAETANKARMAELLAAELFGEFFWEQVGPMNRDWACVNPKEHKSSAHSADKTATHPSDVVFYYNEPYSYSRTYVNCDLKSYSKESITAGAIRVAIESLAKAVACAEVSEEWLELYPDRHTTFDVCGLLFIYNNDAEFDKDFGRTLELAKPQLMLPNKGKLFVLGPDDIVWLYSVANDINKMRGQKRFEQSACSYFYPQLQMRRNVQLENARAATLEVLTSPWIVLRYVEPNDPTRHGFVIFYRDKGEDANEFIYLLDFLRLSEVIQENVKIQVKTFQPSPNAAIEFQRAQNRFIQEIASGPDERNNSFSSLIKQISYSQLRLTVPEFSEIEIGMDYER